MSTVAERVRLAFNAATGESKPASPSWEAANPNHYLGVRNIPGTHSRWRSSEHKPASRDGRPRSVVAAPPHLEDIAQ